MISKSNILEKLLKDGNGISKWLKVCSNVACQIDVIVPYLKEIRFEVMK